MNDQNEFLVKLLGGLIAILGTGIGGNVMLSRWSRGRSGDRVAGASADAEIELMQLLRDEAAAARASAERANKERDEGVARAYKERDDAIARESAAVSQMGGLQARIESLKENVLSLAIRVDDLTTENRRLSQIIGDMQMGKGDR